MTLCAMCFASSASRPRGAHIARGALPPFFHATMAESAAAVPGEASPPLRELKAAILMLVETLKAHDAHLVEQAARQEVQQRQLQRHHIPGVATERSRRQTGPTRFPD